MKDWQKEKIKITTKKFSKKEALAMVDSLNPEFWTDADKAEAKKLIEGGE